MLKKKSNNVISAAVSGKGAGLTEKDLKFLYRWMVFVRLLDERMLNLQRQGRIGFYGTCTGEEASVIGSAYALEPHDWIFPALRQGSAALMRGYSLRSYISQLFGNSADLLKGRQMPVHYSDRRVHQVSWSSCIGTQLPHAVGTAWAAKIRGDKIVTAAYLGDGATSEADFHVAMNFAGVFKTPTVFFCQNNQWAISVPLSGQTASETIAQKAIAYGFEGTRVDGNDVLAVYNVMKEAVDLARSGGGPTLIEALTYRVGAHSTSDDPSRYRDESITEQWKREKDPIKRFQHHLKELGLWNEDYEEALRAEILNEISLALKDVESLPPPDAGTMLEDVYAEIPWHLREQMSDIIKP
jgi:pyruvate dehydrogenase E1 component alpha subunit/2-oxoisovalerate dehydrogenase E1 component alpha subunit